MPDRSILPTIEVNPRALQLGGAAGWVDITDPECLLLQAFAQGQDQRVTTDDLLGVVGKPRDTTGKHALEVQLVRLRKKLTQAGVAGPTIKSIRGRGYQFCVPLQFSSFPA